MRNGSANWDALDDGFGVVADDDEDVEYVIACIQQGW